MEILIIGFFSLFFLISIIAIIYKINILLKESKDIKIELYDNDNYKTNLENIQIGRLSDKTIRSSVRYHNSLYKTNDNYEEYRRINNLQLP